MDHIQILKLDYYLSQNGQTGGDGTQNGHRAESGAAAALDRQGPGLTVVLFQIAALLKNLQMAVHRGRRAQIDGFADLTHSGRIAVLPGKGGDIVQNSLPHRAQFVHNAPRTKHISNNNVFIIAHLFGESKHLFVILAKNF